MLSKKRPLQIPCTGILTPYAGDVETHRMYALLCARDSISRGEAPFAAHLVYPNLFNRYSLKARDQRIRCTFTWLAKADLIAVYTDLGISIGMIQGKAFAETLEIKIENRSLGNVQWLKSYRQNS